MTELRLVFAVAVIGMLGWFLRPLFLPNHARSCPRTSWLIFLGGFGCFSLLLFLTAALGVFHLLPLCMLSVALISMARFGTRRTLFSPGLGRYAAFLLLFLLFNVALYCITPPFESVVASSDSSVFVGAAFQLHKSGSLSYEDPLLQEMTLEERETFTRNRFPHDWTGSRIRFPGGVPVLDLNSSKIGFSFSHLFPAWLAFAIRFIGPEGFPGILSLFSAISLISAGFVARVLAGRIASVAVPALLFCHYLQQYFSRVPLSESLAQALFLGGLSIWAPALHRSHTPSSNEQVLLGVIWGSLMLTRIDALYLLSIALMCAFFLVPCLRREIYRWRPLIASLLISTVLASFYLLKTGTYLYLFSDQRFFGKSAFSFAILGVLDRVLEWGHGASVAGAVLMFSLFSAFVLFLYRRQPSHQLWRVGPTAGFAAAIFLLVPVVGTAAWLSLPDRLGWFTLYSTVPTIIVLLSGFFATVVGLRRPPSLYAVLLILLVIPAICLLARPLVQPVQPTAMRRFYPMVLPLFFLLSAAGLRSLLSVSFTRHEWLRPLSFLLITGAIASSFLRSGTMDLLRPIQTGVMHQVNRMASAVPADALLIVPDSLAGLHLEVPFQFMNDRSVLLLPLDIARGRSVYPIVDNFLRRRIVAGTRVFAVSSENPLFIQGLRQSFQLEPAGAGSVSTNRVQAVPLTEAPGSASPFTLNYAFYRILERAPIEKRRIDFNDSDIVFLNFHDAETGFRWSKAYGLICGFEYSALSPGTILRLKLGPRGPSRVPPRILINDSLPARFVMEKAGALDYELLHSAPLEIRKVFIGASMLVPKEQDSRQLGVSFVSLEFLEYPSGN